MNTDQEQIRGKHDELTQRIIGVFYLVYNELGYGFLESVYQGAMRIALMEVGLEVQTEVSIPVHFHGQVVGLFRADLVVDRKVLLELKSLEALLRQHESQTLHYLRSTELEVALLMNFGPVPKFKRFVLDNSLKHLEQTRNRSVSSVNIGVKPSVPEGN
jgi:GxxExxY protein